MASTIEWMPFLIHDNRMFAERVFYYFIGKSCLLFFYIFLFIFRFAGQMHAELFEDALIYRGKQDGGMNLASF